MLGPSNSDGFGPLQTLFGLKMDRILKGLLQSIFYAKMPVSQAPDGIFGVCKGQKSSEMYGPITGQQGNGPGAEIWPPTKLKRSLGWPKQAEKMTKIAKFQNFQFLRT